MDADLIPAIEQTSTESLQYALLMLYNFQDSLTDIIQKELIKRFL